MSSQALVPSQQAAVSQWTLSDIKAMATAAAESGMFPAIKTPQAAFTLMMLCQAEGLHPIQALRRYHIIEGMPAMRAEAILATFQERGGVDEWTSSSETEAEATFTAPGKSPKRVRWTLEDARRAQLEGRPNWKKYPRQMLRARVISEGIRLAMPSVVVGIYTPEEVQDFAMDDRRGPQPMPPPAPPANQAAIVDVVTEPATPDLDPVTVRRVQTVVSKLELGKLEAEQRQLTGADRQEFLRTARLLWIERAVGHPVESTRKLSPAEAEAVINRANSELGPIPMPPPTGYEEPGFGAK